MRSRLAWLLSLLVFVVAGCSDDAASSSTSTASTEASVGTTTTAAEDRASTATAATPTTTAPSTTTTIAAPVEAYFGDFDMVIVQTTAHSGGGIRPLLAWEPVEGADHYGVYLYAPDGSVYWVWRGEATGVPVGGEPRIREDAPGPSVVEGMTWSVIAYGEDLIPIAASPLRAIAP
ncbi:MAG: hypothetical protein R3290_08685 [Acidimicrobiia bacterium]|nr:hypothetical protein [Acidimicrobiia bacterium]